MRSLYIILLFALSIMGVSVSQGQQTGNAKNLSQNPDTNHVNRLLQRAQSYFFTKPDSCLLLSSEAIELAHQLKFRSGELVALNMAGEAFHFLGDYPQSLEMHFRALEINKSKGDKKGEALTLSYIGFVYIDLNEYRQALNYLNESKVLYESFSDPFYSTFNLSNLGSAYEGMKLLDSALFFQQQALTKSVEFNHVPLQGLIFGRLGTAYAHSGKYEEALQVYQKALKSVAMPSIVQHLMAESFFALNKMDSSLYYARLAFASGKQSYLKKQILSASNLLGKLFRNSGMPDSVIYYQDISIDMNDSLYGPNKLRQLQLLTLKEQKRQQEMLQEKERYKNKTKSVALITTVGFFLIVAIILFRNNRQKQKAKTKIEKAYTDLKSTQAQLIQSEKMASLGELTAGIAHEIQNPLNFVNNFSEVNTELVDELKTELATGNTQLVIEIADNIKENEQKINHHGKRADAIVKGMLQHSRSSNGLKEPTDINALTDEYLRLAYHGVRAKDKSFNANIKTDFDNNIGKINIIPQDIGRVVLNLINNAFYAVDEKRKQNLNGYQPTVLVSTKKINGKVEISVKDNGNGIPQKVLDKIFQPFFTTKPTGQGTGLGLSLAYDIVKAHGGELEVETKEGDGSEFIIRLS